MKKVQNIFEIFTKQIGHLFCYSFQTPLNNGPGFGKDKLIGA